MGEIADMMLDGTMCEGCGEYMGEGDGFPQYCSEQCANDRGANPSQIKDRPVFEAPSKRDTSCPKCGKMCRGHQGYLDHFRVKHDGKAA